MDYKIAYIGENELNRKLVHDIFEPSHIKITGYDSAVSALEGLCSKKYDTIIMESKLETYNPLWVEQGLVPENDDSIGKYLVHKIHEKDSVNEKTPLVILLNQGHEKDFTSDKEKPVKYIKKPVSPPNLIHVSTELVKNHKG